MRALVRRSPLLASTLVAMFAAVPVTVADTILYEPSVYYVPTSYVSTSYVARSYVVPTAYSIAPTTYILPSTYVTPARYVVRRYRPVVYERSYRVVPTTYYLPTTTTLDLPVLATSSVACCDPAPVACDTPATVVTQPLPPPAVNGTTRSSGSSAANPDATGTGESPGLDEGTIYGTPTNPRQRASTPADSTNNGATPGVDTDPPLVPEPGAVTPPTPPATDTNRDALKPRPPVSARSTLSGRVLSSVSGQPERDVAVVIANAVGRFKDKTVRTNDQGEFSVVLPESDWIVRVPKADGSGTIDADVTVAGGVVTDSQDQEVSRLTISR